MKRILPILIFISCLFPVLSQAQYELSETNTTLFIDFGPNVPPEIGNGYFQGNGFSPSPSAGRLNSNSWAVTGWSNGDLAFGGTRTTAVTDYTRGIANSPVATGGIYSYLGTSPLDTFLMIQPGGSDWAPGTITLRVKFNQSRKRLDAVDISYNIMVRNDQDRSNTFNFSYSTDDLTYTNVSLLNYTSPAAADGSGMVLAGARSTSLTGLDIPNGGYLYLRWSGDDVSGGGSRDEFGLDDISIKVQTILPLNFISFTAQNRRDVNYLTWQTAEEKNVDHYEIQRSADAREFRSIGRVDANELRERVNTYSYTDRRPEAGMNYYRIVGVDHDGTTTTSRLATARVGRTGLGVHATVQGQISSPDLTGDALLSVYDTQGRMVFTHAMNGAATIQLPEDIQNGVYLMVLTSGQDVATEKMILQR